MDHQPVLGILCRDGKVWAEIIEGVEAKDGQPLIENKVKKGAIVCSDTWRGYTGIAFKRVSSPTTFFKRWNKKFEKLKILC